jgi:hypothetical protein
MAFRYWKAFRSQFQPGPMATVTDPGFKSRQHHPPSDRTRCLPSPATGQGDTVASFYNLHCPSPPPISTTAILHRRWAARFPYPKLGPPHHGLSPRPLPDRPTAGRNQPANRRRGKGEKSLGFACSTSWAERPKLAGLGFCRCSPKQQCGFWFSIRINSYFNSNLVWTSEIHRNLIKLDKIINSIP